MSVSSSWKAFPKLKREAKCSKKNKSKWKKMLQQHQNRWKMSYVIIICLHLKNDRLTGKLLFTIVCSFFQLSENSLWKGWLENLTCHKTRGKDGCGRGQFSWVRVWLVHWLSLQPECSGWCWLPGRLMSPLPGPANTNTEVPVKFLPFKLSPFLSSMVRARPRPG